ncbi:hypothetical protein ACH5RR_009113 [Cinchona calisaya]|uniref:Uncharacterized protein n=1 Tax=Cinchona calisaya TaxID=153742 RepID=A0ABD3ADD3_9GENT
MCESCGTVQKEKESIPVAQTLMVSDSENPLVDALELEKLHNLNPNDALHASQNVGVSQEAVTNPNAMKATLVSNADQSKGVLKHSVPMQSAQRSNSSRPTTPIILAKADCRSIRCKNVISVMNIRPNWSFTETWEDTNVDYMDFNKPIKLHVSVVDDYHSKFWAVKIQYPSHQKETFGSLTDLNLPARVNDSRQQIFLELREFNRQLTSITFGLDEALLLNLPDHSTKQKKHEPQYLVTHTMFTRQSSRSISNSSSTILND